MHRLGRMRAGRRGRGATTVEFALIMVVFLNFAVGAVEMMSLYSAWSSIQWASDSAARRMMIAASPTPEAAQAAAANLAAGIGYTTAAGATFRATGPVACVSGATIQCITITGSYRYVFRLSTLGLGSITLNSKSVAPLI